MTWYEELDFEDNPLETNPLDSDFDLINREKEAFDVIYHVTAGNMAVIEGPRGSGKTMLLKHVIDNFRGEGRVAFIDAARLGKRLNVETILIKKFGLLGQLFNKLPRNMILLLDNVEEISYTNAERIKYFFDQGYLKSVIFTSVDISKAEISPSLRDRIGKRLIKLKPFDLESAIKIAMSRLENHKIISDKYLQDIFNLSKGDMNLYLKNLEKVLQYTIEHDRQKVSKTDYDEARKDFITDYEPATMEYFDHVTGSELVKVGRFWRNPDTEMYCEVCGTLVEESDIQCAGCNAYFEKEEKEHEED